MDSLTKTTIDLFIQYGPYVAVYLFTEALKRGFKIKGRWVLLTAFGVGLFMASMQLIGTDAKLAPLVFISKTFEKGLIMGAIAIIFRQMLPDKFKGKKGVKSNEVN